ncbi:MAG: hypothetical protein K2X81_20910 [Candidatus Obscuribacterales bacterium]|nr:hypothetical protein [Candidatus Obscuribacterales bacterium]
MSNHTVLPLSQKAGGLYSGQFQFNPPKHDLSGVCSGIMRREQRYLDIKFQIIWELTDPKQILKSNETI